MKICPLCAEQIREEAIKCRYCHSDLREEVDRHTPSSERPRRVAFLGAALLGLGFFAPIMSSFQMGSWSYFQSGTGDGVIVLILAGVSCGCAARRSYRPLWLTGISALVVITCRFIYLYNIQQELKESHADNPFGGLATLMFQHQWRWAVLFAGAFLITPAAELGSRLVERADATLSDTGGSKIAGAIDFRPHR